ncbi:MAG: hypothetical protein Q8S13_09350 [Dehalococcoidia bacterium]|nr:hypothetical protein [Dehalococcoidia bacterium]
MTHELARAHAELDSRGVPRTWGPNPDYAPDVPARIARLPSPTTVGTGSIFMDGGSDTSLVEEAVYWRGLVALAATIERQYITQFTPDDFRKRMYAQVGRHTGEWFYVALGSLALYRSGEWQRIGRNDPTEERLRYAHATRESALKALREAVAPDEPAAGAA